jgi:hypothetical protein
MASARGHLMSLLYSLTLLNLVLLRRNSVVSCALTIKILTNHSDRFNVSDFVRRWEAQYEPTFAEVPGQHRAKW